MSIQYVDQNADVVGTVAGPFAITAGTNDQLEMAIDGGTPQTFTLPAGAAVTAAAIAAEINATITGGAAYACRGSFVRIRSTSANGATSTIQILAPANNANATLGLTAATVSGYGRVLTAMAPTTKSAILSLLQPILEGVGWKTISSSSTSLLMQTRFTPPGQDLVGLFLFQDNGGNCIQVSIQNLGGTLVGGNSTTVGCHLVPLGSGSYNVFANGYEFFIWYPTPTPGREFVCGGLVALPSNVQGVVTDCIWLNGNASSDTDTGSHMCFRTATSCASYNGDNAGNYQFILNSTLTGNSGSTNPGGRGTGQPGLITMGGSDTYYRQGSRWFDGSAFIFDAIFAAGAGINATGYAIGQLWDAFMTPAAFSGDQTGTTSDGHNTVILMDNWSGTSSLGAGTLVLVTS